MTCIRLRSIKGLRLYLFIHSAALFLITIAVICLLAGHARGGDTYTCIEAKGDYISFAPHTPPEDSRIVVAVDSARYEPRWHAMLDERDLRTLTFVEASRRAYYVIERNP